MDRRYSRFEHELPVLPCPECRARRHGGWCRIGNRRTSCQTCNRWAQAVLRITRQRLIEAEPELWDRLRFQVETDLYPDVIQQWQDLHFPDPHDQPDAVRAATLTALAEERYAAANTSASTEAEEQHTAGTTTSTSTSAADLPR